MKRMKKLVSLLLIASLSLLSCLAFTSCQEADDGTYTIGICQLVQHDALDAATQGFCDAVEAGLGKENVTFLKQNAQNDPNTCSTIVNNFVTQKVDLIIANATPALQAAANATTTIPILGTSVTEYSVALSLKDFQTDANGNIIVGGNISGTSDLAPLDQQAAMIREWFPQAQTVGLLFCSAEANSRYQVDVVKAALEGAGLTCTEFSFNDSNDVSNVARSAAACDVIYIPTDNTAAACTEAINGAIGTTPVIAGESGICSGCGVAALSISYYDLGYKTGEMAVQILRGEKKISEMAIAYAPASKKYNAVKCTELGLTVPDGYTPIG